jgi:hypothetical protein
MAIQPAQRVKMLAVTKYSSKCVHGRAHLVTIQFISSLCPDESCVSLSSLVEGLTVLLGGLDPGRAKVVFYF